MKFLKSKTVILFLIVLLVITPGFVYLVVQPLYHGDLNTLEYIWLVLMLVLIVGFVLVGFEQWNKRQPYYKKAKAYITENNCESSMSKSLVTTRYILYIVLMISVVFVLTAEWIVPFARGNGYWKVAGFFLLLLGYFWVIRKLMIPYNRTLSTYSMNHDERLLYEVNYALTKGMMTNGVKTRIYLLTHLLMYYVIEEQDAKYREYKQYLSDYVQVMNSKKQRLFYEFMHKRYDLYRFMYQNDQTAFVDLYEQLLVEEDRLLLVIPKRISLLSIKIKEGDVAVDYYNVLQGTVSKIAFQKNVYQSVLAKTLQEKVR